MAKLRPVGTNQRVLVICVKYSNLSTTRLARASDWVSLLISQVNDFYDRATYGLTTFVFESPAGGPADGWFPIADVSTAYDYIKVGQAAIDAADPYVNFGFYNGVMVITNSSQGGGQGRADEWWRVGTGVEAMPREGGVWVPKRQMGLSIVNEWYAHVVGEPYDEGAAVAAHELGHQLNLQTHYGDLRWGPGLLRDTISPWDVMGYSPAQRHFLGWAKLDRGFLEAARVMSLGPPASGDIDQTVTLKPLERATTSGTQLVKVPFVAGDPFVGFVIENRQRVNGDERLPREGVLITLVDAHPDVEYGTKAIVLAPDSSAVDLDRAALQIGDTFTAPGREIEISVISKTGEDYNVHVHYPRLPAGSFDPAITPWGAPPYWTPDIWIDSEKNGWDTYRYVDAAGNPMGQADDAWIDHVNRVYVQIRNLGTHTASDVHVQVYVNQPPGMGDAGPKWGFLGTIIFPTVPGGGVPVKGYITWIPTVAAHTCIRAVIEEMPGEASTSNNAAQENIAAFDSTAKSPWEPVGLDVQVYNPSRDEETTIVMGLQDVPNGWGFELDPPQLTLAPGGTGSVKLTVYPSGPTDGPLADHPHREHYRPGFIGMPKLQALAPYGDTWAPIGGVELWAHLVHATELTASGRTNDGGGEVDGQLSPAPPGALVAIELRRGEGQRILQHADVREDGSFQTRFELPEAESFKFQVFYAGDMLYAAAETPEQRLGDA